MNVPDTSENRERCLCPSCPSFPHGCKGEILFCSTGSSTCEVRARGCFCPECLVYSTYSLTTLYFCDRGPENAAGVVIRKPYHDEDSRSYGIVDEIHTMAATGESIVCSMGSLKRFTVSLDDLHLVPAQVFRIPRNREEPVDTMTVIGPGACKTPHLSNPGPGFRIKFRSGLKERPGGLLRESQGRTRWSLTPGKEACSPRIWRPANN